MPAEGVKIGSAFIEVRANMDRAHRDIKDFEKNVNKKEAQIGVGANTVAAQAQIATVARDRFVALHVRPVNLAAVEQTFARLSGVRTLNDNVTKLSKSLGNLDKTAPRISTVTTAVAGLSAAVLAGSSNLLVLGGSLASVVPAALALPGMFAGAAIGAGVLMAALKDAPTVLADLLPSLEGLQQGLSGNFWSQAAEPIRLMTNTLLPQFQDKLGTIATGLGGFAATASAHLTNAFGGGALDAMLGHVYDAIIQLQLAIEPVLDTFVTLGTVGSSYLPILSVWLSQLATDFNSFIQGAAADGSLTRWIDTGIAGLKSLGEVIGNASSIFYGLYTAAEAAGGSSLQSLADGLGRIADVVNGPVFQRGLTTVFEGAHAGIAGLGQALDPLATMFTNLAPAIGRVMELAGELGGKVLGSLATALSNPAFGDSIVKMMLGISSGVEAILPSIPALVSAFGMFAETIGRVMAILGPVFSVAITALAPVFESLLAAIVPVAKVLAGALMTAITAIAPHLQTVINYVARFATENPNLAATIVAVAAGVAGLIGAFVSFLPTIAGVIGSVTSLMGSLGGGSAILGVLKTAFSALLGPVGIVIGLLVTAYATSEPFRNAINNLVGTLMGLVKTIMTALAPVLKELVNLFMLVVEQALVPFINMIISVLVPTINALVPVIKTVFNFIATTIRNVMTVVQGIIKVVTGVIKGDWGMVWEGIKQIFSGIWNQIKAILSTALNLVKSIFSGALNVLRSVWETIWNSIKNTISSVWRNGIKPIFDTLSNFIKKTIPGAFETGVNNIKKFWNNLEAIAKKPVKFMVDTVYNNGLRGIFNNVMDFIGSDTRLGRLNLPGFRTGGHTGNGGVNDVAGVVHGKEYVLNAKATDSLEKTNPGLLGNLNAKGAAALGAAAGGGGGFSPLWGGFQNQIKAAGRVSVGTGAGPAWRIPQAASMWDQTAGIRVRAGGGAPHISTGLGALGSILAWANSAGNITFNTQGMAPGMNPAMKLATSAHEIGHVLGLPHDNGASIMQPVIGQYMQPTSRDVDRLRSLYGKGSKNAGGGGFDPLGWVVDNVTKAISGLIEKIPGAGRVLEIATGLTQKIFKMTTAWATDKVKSFFGGGGDDEGNGAKIKPTLFDGGGLLERGMVGVHNKPKPDKVLTDDQWNNMKSIADNSDSSRHGIINNEYNVTMTVNAADIDEIQKVISVFNSLSQTARTGSGTNLRRV